MKIYFSGPITNDVAYKTKFSSCIEEFIKEGVIQGDITIMNPAELPCDLPNKLYMPLCLRMIDEADAVVFLPGWLDSDGSMVEYSYARYQKIPCILKNASGWYINVL